MAYNELGFQTTRGTGTSGYVQKSLSKGRSTNDAGGHFKRRQRVKSSKENHQTLIEKNKNRASARRALVDRNSKRYIDLKLSELRVELEDQELSDGTIDKKVNELREKLNEKPKKEPMHDEQEPKSEEDKQNRDESKRNLTSTDTVRLYQYKPRYSDIQVKNVRLE